MSVRVTGWGGIDEIGGNKFLLEDGDWQVFLDFGKSFTAYGSYFEEFLTPRSTVGTFDYLRTGLLPPLEGIFRPDLERLPEVRSFWNLAKNQPGYRADVRPRALLLSHAHQDHHGYSSFLDHMTPIVSSTATALIMKSLQDSSNPTVENETVFVRPRSTSGPLLRSKPNLGTQRAWYLSDGDTWTVEGERFWNQPLSHKNTADWILRAAEPFSGNIDGHRVRAFPVDHSIPGGCGFAVETSVGWVAYSGDIRLHGHLGQLTERFAEELRTLEVELLICEGTQAPYSHGPGEQDVRLDVHKTIANASGIVVGDFSPRNFERLDTFRDAACSSGRRLVVLEKDAFLLHALSMADPTTPLPNAADGPLIYRERRENQRAWSQLITEKYAAALIEPTEIAKSPNEYVLAASFYDSLRLLDINVQGGEWVYSTSEPYNEEQLLNMDRLRSWVKLLNMRLRGGADDDSGAHFHASGHASGPDLLRFIEIAGPRRLMPVHLERPGLDFYREHVPALGIELVEPTWGHPIEILP